MGQKLEFLVEICPREKDSHKEREKNKKHPKQLFPKLWKIRTFGETLEEKVFLVKDGCLSLEI